LGCLVGLVTTGVLSHVLPAAQARDTASLDGFASLQRTGIDGLLNRIAHLADTTPYLLLSLTVAAVALGRGRPRLATAVLLVLIVAPVTSEILKHLTATPRIQSLIRANEVGLGSWPSGHATGAMALALCAVLVVPQRMRTAVAIAGGLFAIAVGYAVVALVWHFPSDTVGGFLVAAMWALLGVAAVRRWPDPASGRPEPERRPDAALRGSGLVVGAFATLAALAIASTRPGAIVERLAEYPSFAAAAAGIAALAAVLATVFVRSAR
jgi:membrane-associated phospholipid phosphatase